MTQRCPKCGLHKGEDGYAPSHWGKQGYWCRQCKADSNAAKRAEDPAAANAKTNAWRRANKARVAAATRRRQLERREAVSRIKLERGCMDCGYGAAAVALDFDHRPGITKSMDIAAMISSNKSWEAILEEMAKCDVVCANCHRIRTAGRMAA